MPAYLCEGRDYARIRSQTFPLEISVSRASNKIEQVDWLKYDKHINELVDVEKLIFTLVFKSFFIFPLSFADLWNNFKSNVK